MQVFRSAAVLAHLPRRPVSAKTLRMWCSPEIILGVTTLSDEQALLPHIISQARQSGARIILAHVLSPPGERNCRKLSLTRPSLEIRQTRETLERMARQLRWLGLVCEPVLLSGSPEFEIAQLVQTCGADRVLLGFDEDPDLTSKKISPMLKQVCRAVDVPVCVIGRNAIHANRSAIRKVTLAISARSRCEVPLGFACRLAQENRASLTVLHVGEEGRSGEKLPTSQTIISRLPFATWREAELFCPTQIEVREGQPVDQILSHCASTEQDLLILCSPGDTSSENAWRDGVAYRTIAGARCPVLIAACHSDAAVAFKLAASSEPQRFSPQGEHFTDEEGKEALK